MRKLSLILVLIRPLMQLFQQMLERGDQQELYKNADHIKRKRAVFTALFLLRGLRREFLKSLRNYTQNGCGFRLVQTYITLKIFLFCWFFVNDFLIFKIEYKKILGQY